MITEDRLEDERAVLGAMLLDSHRIDEVVSHVSAADFADPVHRELFIVLVDLHNAGEPTSVETLTRTLKDCGRFEQIGGATRLSRLSAATGIPAEAAYYAARVRRAAMVRNLQKILSAALERAQQADSGTASVSGVLDFVDERLAELRELGRAGSDRITPLHDAATRLCDEIDAASQAGTVRGLRTGLSLPATRETVRTNSCNCFSELSAEITPTNSAN